MTWQEIIFDIGFAGYMLAIVMLWWSVSHMAKAITQLQKLAERSLDKEISEAIKNFPPKQQEEIKAQMRKYMENRTDCH